MTTEVVYALPRLLQPKEASALVGTPVGTDLAPTFRSPRPGQQVRVLDADTGATIAAVTRLEDSMRRRLREVVLALPMGLRVARHNKQMPSKGATFGYAPPKPMARLEGCRLAMTSRDNPTAARVLNDTARALSAEFASLFPEQAAHDRDLVHGTVLEDWRLGEDSLWTSGVINDQNVLPYHRDGNNLETWSAMPVLRRGMDGGVLHLPEYDLVFPCGDGTVTWFYGRGLVHGVTPMHRRSVEAYRYSIVFYALRGMVDCATYAEETVKAALTRTIRERAEAARIRETLALADEDEPLDALAALDALADVQA